MIGYVFVFLLLLVLLVGLYFSIALVVWLFTGNDRMLFGIDRRVERHMEKDEK